MEWIGAELGALPFSKEPTTASLLRLQTACGRLADAPAPRPGFLREAERTLADRC
jgi:hypothetical protein